MRRQIINKKTGAVLSLVGVVATIPLSVLMTSIRTNVFLRVDWPAGISWFHAVIITFLLNNPQSIGYITLIFSILIIIKTIMALRNEPSVASGLVSLVFSVLNYAVGILLRREIYTHLNLFSVEVFELLYITGVAIGVLGGMITIALTVNEFDQLMKAKFFKEKTKNTFQRHL